MDQLGALYISAATDVESSCLHDPPRVANLVDQLQTIVDKSTVPRKNFLIDTTTSRGDAVVAESSAMKNGIGWVTLQVTEGIHRGVHEWCIRIEDQGETTDGSGLMVGLVPKSFTKYDSFISQGGGWCLSRAGKFYGHWRRQESESETLTFGTGDRVIFLLDYEAARLVVRVGNRQASGHVSNLSQEVFPAVSLHYRHQHVRFEYHVVHERHDHTRSWVDRMTLPCAPSFLPMSWEQVAQVELDSYLYSSIFAENLAQLHLQRIRRSSLIRLGLERDSFSGASDASGTGAVQHRYASREGICARLTVLRNAFVALHKQAKRGPLAAPSLSADITPEYLRQTAAAAAQAARSALGGSGGRDALGGGATGYDAAMACGGVLLIHLFVAVARGATTMADPLVLSLLDYLLDQPLFALREVSDASSEGPAPFTAVSPTTLQLAADNIATVAEEELAQAVAPPSASPSLPASPRLAEFLSLLLVLSVQRAKVSELLRTCRLLLRAPPSACIAVKAAAWLRQHVAVGRRPTHRADAGCAGTSLWPEPPLFDVPRALQTAVAHAPTLAVPTRLDATTVVLAVGFSGEMVYVHTRDHLSKWGQRQTPQLVLVESTKEPAELCVGAVQSSVAVTSHAVFLATNRMRARGVAVVEYNLSLAVRRVVSLDAAGPHWSPTSASASPLIATAPHDTIVLVRPKTPVEVGARRSGGKGSSGAAVAPPPPPSAAMELLVFSSSSFPSTPLHRVELAAPEPVATAALSHCLALEKHGFVDLGPPLILQGTSGHVTVELLVQLPERTATATTLYRHGDKSTCGEVFIEVTVLDGARCVRGGYRHDTRGACVVSAPLSPLADTCFLHLTLVFDGQWSLYFDGRLVAANSHGPHVSLDTPKLSWCVGEECVCALAGLRVWRVGRSATEVARDYARVLSGTEPGLVRQLLFAERDGNVVFNYSQVNTSGESIHLPPEAMGARHAVCVGGFRHLPCSPSQRLWGSSLGHLGQALPPPSPSCSPLHNWTEPRHVLVIPSGHVALASFIAEDADTVSPYAQSSGTALVVFDAQSGEAKPCVTLVPPKVLPQGLVASDPAGRVWCMLESVADPKSRPEAGSLGGASGNSKPTVLAVALMPFAERGEVPSDAATASELERPVSANLQDTMYATKEDASTAAETVEPAALTCMAAAHKVLRVLAAHAAQPTGLSRACLFAPLRDDVCKETVHEVVFLLGEYVRVVKGSNARRAVSLKDNEEGSGALVVLCALRVLRRLLRQAKAYRLHPSVLDLHISTAEDEKLMLHELMPALNADNISSPPAPRTEVSQPAASSVTSTVHRLLSLLASILNDGSLVVPPVVLRAAADALREGVDLIFASVDVRARVLQGVLDANDTTAVAGAETSAKPDPQSAMDVVKQALERSFASIATASALLTVAPPSAAARPSGVGPGILATTRRTSLSLSELLEAQASKLQRVQRLLEAILTASLREMQMCVAPPDLLSSADTASAGDPPLVVEGLMTEHRKRLSALSATLTTLQMALLGTCITPGASRSTRRGSGGGETTTSTARGPTDEATAYIGVTEPFAIHADTEVHHHEALKAYYAALFRAAREGLRLVLRGDRRSSTGLDGISASAAAPPVLWLSSPSASCSQSMPLLHSPLGRRRRVVGDLGGPGAAWSDVPAAGGPPPRRSSLKSPQMAVAELSFLSTPLHTALSALPYVLTPANAAWFLDELQSLLPLTESAQQLCKREGGGEAWQQIDYSAAFDATHDATVLALGWTSVYLATVEQAQKPSRDDVSAPTGTTTPEADVQWLLASPFVANGIHDAAHSEGDMDNTPNPTSASAPSTVTSQPVSRRQRGIQSLLETQSETCAQLQRTLDGIGKSTPAPLLDVLTQAAMTALYMSHTHEVRRLGGAKLRAELTYIFRRLIPLRNTLLPSFRGQANGSSSPSPSSSELATELTRRCTFMRTLTHMTEVDVLTDPLFQVLTPCGRFTPKVFPSSARARWQCAIGMVRERIALRRILSGGAEELALPQALSVVTRVLGSETLTSACLSQRQQHATRLAGLRLAGLKALRRLVVRVPSSVECVSYLLHTSENSRCQGDARATSSSDGIYNDPSVRLAPSPLRLALVSTLHAVVRCVQFAELATAHDVRQMAVHVPTATTFEVQHCPTSVLCDVLHFSWGARDLPLLRLSGAVADVFAGHASLFVLAHEPDVSERGRAHNGPTGDRTVLREESPTARRHRDKAAQYASAQRRAARTAGPDGTAVSHGGQAAHGVGEDEELAAGATLATARELNARRVFHCLRHLGLHSCGALCASEGVSLGDRLCYAHFTTGLLTVLSDELARCTRCVACAAHDGDGDGSSRSTAPALLPVIVERVEAQVRLVCSVLSAYAGVLPAPPAMGDVVVFRELSTACATASRGLLVLAESMRVHKRAHAACVRTAMALLSRCHPDACDAVFCTAPATPMGTPDSKVSATSGATLSYVVGYATNLLETRGVDGVAVHAVEGLRVLLTAPQWVRHLGTTAATDFLGAVFRRQVVPGVVPVHDRLAMLTCLCALGGCLPREPLRGLPCEIYSAGSATPGLPANAYPLAGYIVDVMDSDEDSHAEEDANDEDEEADESGTSEGRGKSKKKNKRGSRATAARRVCVDLRENAPAITEVNEPPGAVFLPTNSAAHGTTVCPAWACDDRVATAVLARVLAPQVAALEALVREGSSAHTSTDLVCLAVFLDLVRQLVTSAKVCHALAVHGVLRAVNQLASSMALRTSLPLVTLKEFAAVAWGRVRQNARHSTARGSPSSTREEITSSSPHSPRAQVQPPSAPAAGTATATTSTPLGPVAPARGQQRVVTAVVAPATALGSGDPSRTDGGGALGTGADFSAGYMADLLRVRAQVMSLMGQDSLGGPSRFTTTPTESSAFVPSGRPQRVPTVSAVVTSAANGTGRGALSGDGHRLFADTLGTLCFYAHPQQRIPGTLTVVGAEQIRGGATLSSLCAAGCTVELSVLLCHRVFVDLGESCRTQDSWSPAAIELDLITVCGGGGDDACCVKVSLSRGQLVCSVATVGGGSAGQSTPAASLCSLALAEDDHDRFLHIAVFVDTKGITLAKGGSTTTASFAEGSAQAQRVRALLAEKGGVQRIVLGCGVPVADVTGDGAVPLDATMVLLSGLRVSSGTTLRASVKAFADLVARDRTLPMLEPLDEPCAFTFHEGGGTALWSTSHQYTGRLAGVVRWTPLCYGMPPLAKDRSEALYTGNRATMPHRGVAAAGASSAGANDVGGGPTVPRTSLEAYLEKLSAEETERYALDHIWSLCAYWSRAAVVAALTTCTHASYAVASGATFSDVFSVIDKTRLLSHLVNLLAFGNTAELADADARLVQTVVTHALSSGHVSEHPSLKNASQAPMSLAERQAFLRELTATLPERLADVHERLTVRVPLGGAGASAAQATAPSGASVVLPLAVLRPGAGAILSFDLGKPRHVDQVLVCRDDDLNTVVASYPDVKGGWGGAALPQEIPSVFLRVVHAPSARDSGAAATLDMTLSVRSLRPVLARAVFSAACACARRATERAGDGNDDDNEWPFFRSELIAVLAAQCVGGGPLADESTHVAAVLGELLQTWAAVPHRAVTARAPLHVLLAPLNEMLVPLLQSRRDGLELSAMRSPSMGTYNVYLQELFGVLGAAMSLDAAWRGLTVEQVAQYRWQRTIQLWRQSTQETSTTRSAEVQQMLAAPGESVTGAPVSRATKLTSGEWDLIAVHGQPGLLCRCSTGCAAGCFYFEITVPAEIGRCREFAVGVATAAMTVRPGVAVEDTVGMDSHSWLFSGARSCCLHDGVRHEFPARLRWKSGDVIGVLIDRIQRRMTCVQNGRHVGAFDKMDGGPALFPLIAFVGASESPLSPTDDRHHGAAAGALAAHCRLNFGALSFLYPPTCDYLAVDPVFYSGPGRCRLWLLALGAQWARQQPPDETIETSAARADALLTVARRCLDVMASRVATACDGRAGPLWVRTMATRRGPGGADTSATVDDTPDGLLCWEDGAQGFVRGTVSVTRGQWYYEVVVLRGAGTTLSAGWSTTSYQNDGGTVPGDDDHSWMLEGKRMVAKHAGGQRNLDRVSWVDGDVLGCALDCDAGTISFSLNGETISVMTTQGPLGSASTPTTTPTGTHAPVFEGLAGQDALRGGLTPCLYMRGKTVVQLRWGRTDLQYLPMGHQPLEAAGVLWAGLAEHVLFTDHTAPPAAASPSLSAAALERTVTRACASADISPVSLNAHCVDVSASPSSPPPVSGMPDTGTGTDSGRAAACVKVISGIAEVLFPFAHVGAVPPDVDPSGAQWTQHTHPLRRVLSMCRPLCLPYLGLQTLRSFIKATNGAGEGVRLTLNRRGALAVVSDGSLPEEVRVRRSLVGQVHTLLQDRGASLFLTNKKLWSVVFSGEGAEDVGGPYRECLSQMSSELMSAALPFFVPSDNQTSEMGERRDLFIPNPTHTRTTDRAMYLFLGRLMGGCLRGNEPLSFYLPSVVWKALLGEHPGVDDLAQMDAATAQALAYIEERLAEGAPSDGALDETLLSVCPGGFSVTDACGCVHPLVDGGERVAVTSSNAALYVQLVREWKLSRQFGIQLEALKEGFLQVVPRCAISFFKWPELEKAVCGQRDYDSDALLDHALYDGIAPDDQRVLFLRQVLRDFTPHERALFMRFVSGRERLPQGLQLRIQADVEDSGEAQMASRAPLVEANGAGQPGEGDGPVTVPTMPRRPSQPRPAASPRRTPQASGQPFAEPSSSDAEQRLPHASTCFFILSLPRYRTQQILHDKLLFAIEQCIDMDADFRVRDGRDTEPTDGPVLAHVDSEDELFEDFTHLQ